VAVFKKKANFLDVHMQIPIGQSRGRGQPKKNAPALVKQDDGLKVSSSSSSSVSDEEEDSSPVKKKTAKKITKINTPKKRGPKTKY